MTFKVFLMFLGQDLQNYMYRKHDCLQAVFSKLPSCGFDRKVLWKAVGKGGGVLAMGIWSK